MAVVISLALVALVGRLADLQVLGAGRGYVDYGVSQMTSTIVLPALRGSILDRNGNVLAMSVAKTDIFADPNEVVQPTSEAAKLAPVLGVPASVLAGEMRQKTSFVYLAKGLGQKKTAAVEKMGLTGIGWAPSSERVAPAGTLGDSVLGFTDGQGAGVAGIEQQYNSVLTGVPGSEEVEESPAGSTLPGGTRITKPARPGASVELTLDSALQYDAEQALAHEIESSHATSGLAVIEDVRTGQILAMTDLVRKGAGVVQSPSNTAVTSVYEPGSVMKLTTMAAALTTGKFTPQSVLPIPSSMMVGGYLFHDAEAHGPEKLTLSQVLAQSSNLGTIEVAKSLGAPTVAAWINRFGFGAPTGLRFPGASAGLVRPLKQWSGSSIGSGPIGQMDGVTAQQVLDAYTAIADGGVTVTPQLVRGIEKADGEFVPAPSPKHHRVVTTHVASQLTGMFEGVATGSGTAPAAAIPGYTVAGKTGTAQIPYPNKPGYIPGAFMATFVGFVPAQAPVLSAIVVLDRPTPIYGGSVAAPVFSRICQEALRLLDVAPPSVPASLAGPSQSGNGG